MQERPCVPPPRRVVGGNAVAAISHWFRPSWWQQRRRSGVSASTAHKATLLASSAAVLALVGGRSATRRTAAISRPATRGRKPKGADADDESKPALSAEERAKNLAKAVKGLKRFGDQSLAPVETFTSGALNLDLALGGGWAKGKVVEVYGPESSGKTTLALLALREAQREGGNGVFIDAEHALDESWARRLGVDMDNLLHIQPDSGEEALDTVSAVLDQGEPGLIVVDSVAQLTPQEEIDKGYGQNTIGLLARMMSKAMRKIPPKALEAKCTVLFLNQIRMKIGVVYGSPETRSGGNALKYAASQIVDVRRKELTKKAGDADFSGLKIKAKVVKNKIAPPYRSAELDISFEAGISQEGSMVSAAEALGIITRKGAFYYFGDQRLGQGLEKSCQFLQGNPELKNEIESLTRGAALRPVPESPALAQDATDPGEDAAELEAAKDAAEFEAA